MRLLYGHGVRLDGKYELNSVGQRLARMLAARVSEANGKKRNGLKLHAEALVQVVDLLRALQMWTEASALIEFYGFTETEFYEAESAASKMLS